MHNKKEQVKYNIWRKVWISVSQINYATQERVQVTVRDEINNLTRQIYVSMINNLLEKKYMQRTWHKVWDGLRYQTECKTWYQVESKPWREIYTKVFIQANVNLKDEIFRNII